jgi:phospholipase C
LPGSFFRECSLVFRLANFVRGRRAAALLVACGSIALASCSGRAASPAPFPITSVRQPAQDTPPQRPDLGHRPSGKIKHVVFILQENRGFNNLFQGYPGADTVPSGLNSKGQTIPLTPISLAASYDIDHSSYAFFAACNGSPPGLNCLLNGFDREYTSANPSQYPTPQYGYVPHSESKLYFDMANQYVLGDRTFTSHLDASYISHMHAVAGQANHAVDFPSISWACAGPGNTIGTLNAQRQYSGQSIPVCQDYQTLGDELDAAGKSWRHYAAGKPSGWNGYSSIKHIRFGPDWQTNVFGSAARVLKDVKAGTLANVTWITPTCANSDHAGCGSTHGPDWVATIVNTIGRSPFWNSTAIFVMWDEWGGWYDHVQPPYVDYDGLGLRVPLLVISPYAKRGHVSHLQYEHGSILRFIEDEFGLAQLTASDSRANSPAADCFDFKRPPRAFHPFKTALSAEDFIRTEPAELKVPLPE